MTIHTDSLYLKLAAAVARWRIDDYPCPEYPAIAEVFEWGRGDDAGTLRYLRRPQLRALEIYWFFSAKVSISFLASLRTDSSSVAVKPGATIPISSPLS